MYVIILGCVMRFNDTIVRYVVVDTNCVAQSERRSQWIVFVVRLQDPSGVHLSGRLFCPLREMSGWLRCSKIDH